MRIVHLVARYGPLGGGSGRWSAGVATALAAAGHEVTVLTVTPRGPSVAWGRFDVDAGVVVRRCAPSPPLWALQRLRRRISSAPPPRSVELRGALVRAVWRADVVHIVGGMVPEAAWTRFVCRLLRRPVVVTPAPEQRVLRAGGTVGAVGWSPVVGGGPVAVAGEERIVVMPADGDCDGVLTTVDAVRLLRLDGLPVVPVIAGDVPVIDARVRRLWKASAIPVCEVPAVGGHAWAALLADAAAVVLPPHADAGLAYDAWAAGVPVLVPDGLLGEGAAAYAVGDPLALARELARLLRDVDARVRLVGRAKACLEAVATWTEVAAGVAEVYAAVVGGDDVPAEQPADRRRPAAGSAR